MATWDLETGQPAEGADTLEAVEVMERAMQQIDKTNAEPHPGLLHVYIHTMEMSPYPERALPAGDIYANLFLMLDILSICPPILIFYVAIIITL